ncbi:MAG: transglutaminase family protein [Dehalococcoidales bacterium]|nr:transglutaminase family protein [Dehalococcoidales bacterium]
MAEGISWRIDPKTGKKLLITAAVAVGVGIFLSQISSKPSGASVKYPTNYLVDPDSVSEIATQLPNDEDDFILSAWDYVHNKVRYSSYNTDIFLINSGVECTRCYHPISVLQSGSGNCVASASLLTSLLRAKLSPDRVYEAVGYLDTGKGDFGHAWVEAKRNDGNWYLLESTSAPWGWQSRNAANNYETLAKFNDAKFECYSHEMCQVAMGCPCEQRSERWRGL